MKNPMKMLMVGSLIAGVIFALAVSDLAAAADVYYGDVVVAEGKTLRIKGKDGRVSLFWLGHRTQFDSRTPVVGDRVKIEYVKDRMRRNAVTRVMILSK